MTTLAGQRTVAVAMSGGIDSSVTAAILQREGHRVVGVTMTHRLIPRNDALDRVADSLGVPLYNVDVGHAFDEVIEKFVGDYYAGRTPNPCVNCNATVKFGFFADAALAIARRVTSDPEPFLATGHYARIENGQLLKACDATKDQSYVLYRLRRDLLSRLVFPLGATTKDAVRRLARDWKIPADIDRESQDICFIPTGDRAAFLQSRRPFPTDGFFVTEDGTRLAEHDGYEQFTVGQRKGFKVGLGRRLFVTRIDAASHDVVLGDRDALACAAFSLRDIHWLIDSPREQLRCEIKVRYRTPAQFGTVACCGEDGANVVLDSPADGVAPGQSAVFYDGERVIGGGVIA
ncbi:MAG: tRNA 2-thiouridine(34) synthase MnmA [Thermoguttaceae bacterium]